MGIISNIIIFTVLGVLILPIFLLYLLLVYTYWNPIKNFIEYSSFINTDKYYINKIITKQEYQKNKLTKVSEILLEHVFSKIDRSKNYSQAEWDSKHPILKEYKPNKALIIKNNVLTIVNVNRQFKQELFLDNKDIDEVTIIMEFINIYQNMFFKVIKVKKDTIYKQINQSCDIDQYLYLKSNLNILPHDEEIKLLDKKRKINIDLLNYVYKFNSIFNKEELNEKTYLSKESINDLSEIVLEEKL